MKIKEKMGKVADKKSSAERKQMKPDLMIGYDRAVPHIIKYMGSKKNILEFVIEAINDVYEGGKLYDLFAGTSILSGALGKAIPMHSNDIQEYSAVLAYTYLSDYRWGNYSKNILEEITFKASAYVNEVKKKYPKLTFSYEDWMTIQQFADLEKAQQNLIDSDFNELSHHLFIQSYSGTYWSFEQCLWIDALRKVADDYKKSPIYYLVLSSLMFAMSYTTQSTGHFAQYRDATNKSSKIDILIYRRKEVLPYFKRKFLELQTYLNKNQLSHSVSSLDYLKCLDTIEPNSLVYADPPYAFVHYSRFYHALETLVKYDYPDVDHKGRYRVDRHQSPFCKATEVKNAFSSMFVKIKEKGAKLILSYSNTGMITLEQITNLAKTALGKDYTIDVRECDHIHSTMGRSDDKNKDVKEYLIIAKVRP